MLAELAAANAAFAVIKQAVRNGKEIAAAGSAIAEFVGAKEKLQSKAAKKGNGSDLEEFMALEQIREKEEELKQMMIILGRPGLCKQKPEWLDARQRLPPLVGVKRLSNGQSFLFSCCVAWLLLVLWLC